MRKRIAAVCAIGWLSLSVLGPNLAWGEESGTGVESLVGLLPDGVLGFIATSGSDQLSPAFSQSALGKVWNEPSVQNFVRDLKKELMNKVDENLGAAQTQPATQPGATTQAVCWKAEKILQFAKLVLSRPLLIGAAQYPATAKPTDATSLPIYGFLLVDTGNRKAEIASMLSELETASGERVSAVKVGAISARAVIKESGEKALWGWAGNYFVMEFGDGSGFLLQHLSNPPKTQTGAAYLKALGSVPGAGDSLVMYADPQQIGRLVDMQAKISGEQADLQKMRSVLEQLGLTKVGLFVSRSGFAGADLVEESMITVPEPRTGIFKALGTIDLSIFNRVPSQIMKTWAVNPDPAGLYDTILDAVKAADPNTFINMQTAIAKFEGEVKINLRRDLVGNVSGPMVGYASVAGGAVALIGPSTVFTAKVKDPKAFEQAMSALEKYIEKKAEGNLQPATQTIDGKVFHVWMIPALALMQIAPPCWAVDGNDLVMSTSLDSCRQAVFTPATRTANPDSILADKDFQQFTRKLPRNLVYLAFDNDRLEAQQTMQILQQVWPIVSMQAQKAGMKLPILLPPASDIVKHAMYSLEYGWFDQQGFRSRAQGTMMTSTAVAPATGGMAIGILVPAVSRAREVAKRSASASNLRHIGLAYHNYAQEHAGKFPDNYQKVIDAKLVSADMFRSPLKPASFGGPSYIFLPVPESNVAPNTILGYENPEYLREGTNVLHIDASVEWMKPDTFREKLAETCRKLNIPVPPVRFANDSQLKPADTSPSEESHSSRSGRFNLDKKIPFRCTNCGLVRSFAIRELQKMQKPDKADPSMGPMKLDCTQCGKKTLTQAVECPKCQEIFVLKILKIDATRNSLDDKCPKCGESYIKAWQEKYRKPAGS